MKNAKSVANLYHSAYQAARIQMKILGESWMVNVALPSLGEAANDGDVAQLRKLATTWKIKQNPAKPSRTPYALAYNAAYDYAEYIGGEEGEQWLEDTGLPWIQEAAENNDEEKLKELALLWEGTTHGRGKGRPRKK